MTRRKEIIEILKKEPKSAQELANYYRIEMFEIIDDLEHIKKTVKPQNFKIYPAQCMYCGFVFKERSKIKSPTKCPKCRNERIQAMKFRIT